MGRILFSRFLSAVNDFVTAKQGASAGNYTDPWVVRDDFVGEEALVEQSGSAGGVVRTFTFANPVTLVLLEAAGATLVARALVGSQTPTAALGVKLSDGEKVYLPTSPTTTVKVWIPLGCTVNAYGWRR